MERTLAIVAALMLSTPSSMGVAQPSAQDGAPRMLTAGDPAPDFSLVGSDGRTYTLSAYRGKQVVVLAWFARAFSGG